MMNKILQQERDSLSKERTERQQELLKRFQEISNQIEQQTVVLKSSIEQKNAIGGKRVEILQESLNHLPNLISLLTQTCIDGQKELSSELQSIWSNSNQSLLCSFNDSISKTAKSTTFYVLRTLLPMLLLLCCGIVYQISLSSGAKKVPIHEEFPGLRQRISTLQKSNEEMMEKIENYQQWKVSQHRDRITVETPDQWIYLLTKNGIVEELRVNEDWACVQVDRVENKE